MDGRADRWIGGWDGMDGWMDEYTVPKTGGWMDG